MGELADYIGCTVAKQFPGHGKKKFKGTCTKVVSVNKEQYLRIHYEDGDTEDLTEEEVLGILAEEAPGKKRKTPSKATPKASKPAAAVADSSSAPASGSKKTGIKRTRVHRPKNSPAYCSTAAHGSLLFFSDIVHTTALSDEEKLHTSAEYYFEQARIVLDELEGKLLEAGVGKESLLSVNIKLKDAEAGWTPFAEEWNAWLAGVPPPTISVCEAFLGNQGRLIGISGVAVMPQK